MPKTLEEQLLSTGFYWFEIRPMLAGRKVVITGQVHGMSRPEVEGTLRDLGAEIISDPREAGAIVIGDCYDDEIRRHGDRPGVLWIDQDTFLDLAAGVEPSPATRERVAALRAQQAA